MRSLSRLIIINILVLASSACIANKDIKITNNKVAEKVDVSVGGVRVSISNTEVAQLEKEKADLAQQLEAVRSQLAAKDTLLVAEVTKLQGQMATLLEKNQAITERLTALRQNDSGLRKELERNREEVARLREDLEKERAAREAAEKRPEEPEEAEKAESAEPEEIIWSAAAIENRTRCRIHFQVLADGGTWENYTINPGGRWIFKRQGEEVQVRFDSQTRSADVLQFSKIPTDSDLTEVSVSYFDFDENGAIELFSEE